MEKALPVSESGDGGEKDKAECEFFHKAKSRRTWVRY
jgi:hypothetical protein